MTTVDRYSPWIKAIQYVPTLEDKIRQSLKLTNMAADHLVERVELDRADGCQCDPLQELMQISQHLTEPCCLPFYREPEHAMKLISVLVQRIANHHAADAAAGRAQDIADMPDEALSDLLLLVGVTRSTAEVAEWNAEQRSLAYEWAAATHLSASDNDVPVPERPEFLEDKGEES